MRTFYIHRDPVLDLDRRLVYDEMFGYMWYNAVEGPESEEELLV